MVDYNDYDKTIFKSMSVLSVALKLSNYLYQKPNPTFYNIVITKCITSLAFIPL